MNTEKTESVLDAESKAWMAALWAYNLAVEGWIAHTIGTIAVACFVTYSFRAIREQLSQK